MKNNVSNSEKIREFIDLLIEKTESNTIVWRTMPYNGYCKAIDDFNRLVKSKRNELSHKLQTAAQMTESLANSLSNNFFDMRVYYTKLKGTEIYLVEQIDYDFSLPRSTFDLTLLNVSDKGDDYKYTLEFKNDKEKIEVLGKLASYVTPMFDENNDKAMAMDYIDRLIEENKKN